MAVELSDEDFALVREALEQSVNGIHSTDDEVQAQMDREEQALAVLNRYA